MLTSTALPQLDATPQLRLNKSMLLYVIIPSALVGVLSGCFFMGKKSYFVAGALPWFGFLAVLMYDIYWRHSGHAQAGSMWPIAQMIGGTLAAVTGVVACAVCRGALKLLLK